MLVDLKVKTAEELQDGDLLVYNKKEGAMVPFRKEDLIRLFGFDLAEIQKTITNTNTRIDTAEGHVVQAVTKTTAALNRVAQRQINFVKIFKGGIKK